jgi:hypothetical protein
LRERKSVLARPYGEACGKRNGNIDEHEDKVFVKEKSLKAKVKRKKAKVSRQKVNDE